jgi:transposase
MNKTHIELRKIFIRLNQAGKSAREIADITGVKNRNIYNWRAVLNQDNGTEKLLSEPSKYTRKPILDVVELKKYIEANPLAFNKEVAIVFGVTKSTIDRWRHKLGFKRKKAKYTYKEGDAELKKTLPQNL